LALAYLKLGENFKVIFHCKKVLEIDDANCKALYRMSLAYTNRGDYDEASELLKRALLIEPLNNELNLLKERIKKEKNDYAEKQKELRRRIFAVGKKETTTNCQQMRSIVFSFVVVIIFRIIQTIVWIKNLITRLWLVRIAA